MQALLLICLLFCSYSIFLGFVLFLVYVGGLIVILSYCIILIPSDKFDGSPYAYWPFFNFYLWRRLHFHSLQYVRPFILCQGYFTGDLAPLIGHTVGGGYPRLFGRLCQECIIFYDMLLLGAYWAYCWSCLLFCPLRPVKTRKKLGPSSAVSTLWGWRVWVFVWSSFLFVFCF